MIGKSILLALTLASGYGTYYMYEQIHTPKAPSAVRLPLGAQNRDERLVYSGWREVGEPYLVKYDLTIDQLPKSAWCHGSGWSESRLDLDCVWPTPSGETRFAATTVGIPLPSTDVYAWHFDRASLSAVPEMRSWFTVNIGEMLGMCMFALLTAIFSIFTLPERREMQKVST